MKYGQIFPTGRQSEAEPAVDQSSSEDEAAEDNSKDRSLADETRRSESISADSDIDDVTTKSSDASDRSDVDLSIDGFSDDDGNSYKHRFGDSGTRSHSPSSITSSIEEPDRLYAFSGSAGPGDGVNGWPVAMGIHSLSSSCAVVRGLQFIAPANARWPRTYWPTSWQKHLLNSSNTSPDTGNVECPASDQGQRTSDDDVKADHDDEDDDDEVKQEETAERMGLLSTSAADKDFNTRLRQMGTRSNGQLTQDGELVDENWSSVDETDNQAAREAAACELSRTLVISSSPYRDLSHVASGLCSEEFRHEHEFIVESVPATSLSRFDGRNPSVHRNRRLNSDLEEDEDHETDEVAFDADDKSISCDNYDDVDTAPAPGTLSNISYPPFGYVPTVDQLPYSVEVGYNSTLHDSGYFSLNDRTEVRAAEAQVDRHDLSGKIKIAKVNKNAQSLPGWIDTVSVVEANDARLAQSLGETRDFIADDSEDSPREVLSTTASDSEHEHVALAYERVLALKSGTGANSKDDDSSIETSDVEPCSPRTLTSIDQTSTQTAPASNSAAVVGTSLAVLESMPEVIDADKAPEEENSPHELDASIERGWFMVSDKSVESDDVGVSETAASNIERPIPRETSSDAVTDATIATDREVNNTKKLVDIESCIENGAEGTTVRESSLNPMLEMSTIASPDVAITMTSQESDELAEQLDNEELFPPPRSNTINENIEDVLGIAEEKLMRENDAFRSSSPVPVKTRTLSESTSSYSPLGDAVPNKVNYELFNEEFAEKSKVDELCRLTVRSSTTSDDLPNGKNLDSLKKSEKVNQENEMETRTSMEHTTTVPEKQFKLSQNDTVKTSGRGAPASAETDNFEEDPRFLHIAEDVAAVATMTYQKPGQTEKPFENEELGSTTYETRHNYTSKMNDADLPGMNEDNVTAIDVLAQSTSSSSYLFAEPVFGRTIDSEFSSLTESKSTNLQLTGTVQEFDLENNESHSSVRGYSANGDDDSPTNLKLQTNSESEIVNQDSAGTGMKDVSTFKSDSEPVFFQSTDPMEVRSNTIPLTDKEPDVTKGSIEDEELLSVTMTTHSSHDSLPVKTDAGNSTSPKVDKLTMQHVFSASSLPYSSPPSSVVVEPVGGLSISPLTESSTIHTQLSLAVRGGVAGELFVKNDDRQTEIESLRSLDFTEPDVVEQDNETESTRPSVQQSADGADNYNYSLSGLASRLLTQSPDASATNEFSSKHNGHLTGEQSCQSSLVGDVGLSERSYDNEQLLQDVSGDDVSELCVLRHQQPWTEAANPAGAGYQLADNETDVNALANVTLSTSSAIKQERMSTVYSDAKVEASRRPFHSKSFNINAMQQPIPVFTANCGYEYGPGQSTVESSLIYNFVGDTRSSAFSRVRRRDTAEGVNAAESFTSRSLQTTDAELSRLSSINEDSLTRSQYYFESIYRDPVIADKLPQIHRDVSSQFSHSNTESAVVTSGEFCADSCEVKLPSKQPLNLTESPAFKNWSSCVRHQSDAALKQTRNRKTATRSAAGPMPGGCGERRRYEPVDYLEGDDVWQTEKMLIFRSVKLRPIDCTDYTKRRSPPAFGLSCSFDGEKTTASMDLGQLPAGYYSVPDVRDQSRSNNDDLLNENISLWRRLSKVRQNYADQLRTMQDERRSRTTEYRLLQLEESRERCRLTQLQVQYELEDSRRHQLFLATAN